MLASATAYSRGSSPKCCVTIQISRIFSTKMQLWGKYHGANFSEKCESRFQETWEKFCDLQKDRVDNNGPNTAEVLPPTTSSTQRFHAGVTTDLRRIDFCTVRSSSSVTSGSAANTMMGFPSLKIMRRIFFREPPCFLVNTTRGCMAISVSSKASGMRSTNVPTTVSARARYLRRGKRHRNKKGERQEAVGREARRHDKKRGAGAWRRGSGSRPFCIPGWPPPADTATSKWGFPSLGWLSLRSSSFKYTTSNDHVPLLGGHGLCVIFPISRTSCSVAEVPRVVEVACDNKGEKVPYTHCAYPRRELKNARRAP